jgi:hypothetical protein
MTPSAIAGILNDKAEIQVTQWRVDEPEEEESVQTALEDGEEAPLDKRESTVHCPKLAKTDCKFSTTLCIYWLHFHSFLLSEIVCN